MPRPRGSYSKRGSLYAIPDDKFVNLSPAEAQPVLDACALIVKGNPNDTEAFTRIHIYLHRFMMGLSFDHFIIPGMEGKDIYQECLIALTFKAIHKFDPSRGMSFFNFAKMCVRRHLITLLNAALHRKKDQPLNRALPIDTGTDEEEDTDWKSFANVLPDEESDFVEGLCETEDKGVTVDKLRCSLSDFETHVLHFYLVGSSYREIAKMVSAQTGRRCDGKSVDNALLRIRKKALALRANGGREMLPLLQEGRRTKRRKKRDASDSQCKATQ